MSYRTPSDVESTTSRQSKGGGRCAGWRTGRRHRRALRLPTHRRRKAAFAPYVVSDMKKRRYVGTALVRLPDRAAKPGCRMGGNARSFNSAFQRVKCKLQQSEGARAGRENSRRLLLRATTVACLRWDRVHLRVRSVSESDPVALGSLIGGAGCLRKLYASSRQIAPDFLGLFRCSTHFLDRSSASLSACSPIGSEAFQPK